MGREDYGRAEEGYTVATVPEQQGFCYLGGVRPVERGARAERSRLGLEGAPNLEDLLWVMI